MEKEQGIIVMEVNSWNTREARIWPIAQYKNNVWFSDTMVNGIYYIKNGDFENVHCEILPEELDKHGIKWVYFICFLDDKMYIFPTYLNQPYAVYDLRKKHISYHNPIGTGDETLDKGFVVGSNLVLVPHYSNVCVYEIELNECKVVSKCYYNDGLMHKTWLPFLQGRKLYIPGTDQKTFSIYSDGKIQELNLAIHNSLMSMVQTYDRKDEFWAYTEKIDDLYRVDGDGKIIQTVSINAYEKVEGSLFRVIPFHNILIFLHSILGILIYDLETEVIEEITKDELRVNHYEGKLNCMYVGCNVEEDKVDVFSYGNHTVEIVCVGDSYKTFIRNIELPMEIRNDYIDSKIAGFGIRDGDVMEESRISTLNSFLNYVMYVSSK